MVQSAALQNISFFFVTLNLWGQSASPELEALPWRVSRHLEICVTLETPKGNKKPTKRDSKTAHMCRIDVLDIM